MEFVIALAVAGILVLAVLWFQQRAALPLPEDYPQMLRDRHRLHEPGVAPQEPLQRKYCQCSDCLGWPLPGAERDA